MLAREHPHRITMVGGIRDFFRAGDGHWELDWLRENEEDGRGDGG